MAYIDREKLKKLFIDGVRVYDGKCTLKDVLHNIDNTPVADVVEVKHGEWNVVPTFDEPDCEYQAFECSCCGNLEVCEENYCYNCGAKMDGRSEGDDR